MVVLAANLNTSEATDSKATGSAICKYCGGEIAIRNPMGNCDHLYWPDNLTDEARRINGFLGTAPPCSAVNME